MSLKHGRDEERARHINAIYTEIALNNVRQKEARDQTEKEKLETALKDATRDMVRIIQSLFEHLFQNLTHVVVTK